MRAPHLPRQREAENPASGDHEDVLLRDVTCLGSVLSRIMNELDPFFFGRGSNKQQMYGIYSAPVKKVKPGCGWLPPGFHHDMSYAYNCIINTILSIYTNYNQGTYSWSEWN